MDGPRNCTVSGFIKNRKVAVVVQPTVAWRKNKLISVVILLLVFAGFLVVLWGSRQGASQRQYLDDGSLLVLNRVIVDSQIRIAHGTRLSKVLGNLVPSDGVHVLNLNLDRRTLENYEGKSLLVAEFSLIGPKAAKNPMVQPSFFRQFRVVMYGDSGIEYVQELSSGQFRSYPDGYYGYIVTSRFPRQSQWLGFRIEKRQSQDRGGPWERVADLKIRNPAKALIEPWVAESTPIVKSVGGLDLVLGKVTVKSIPYMTNDIWNHIVTAPTEVRSNGMILTNWSAAYGYVRAEDASGNWDMLASHRSLDPSYVWKLETDFEPQSDFAPDSVATLRLPAGRSTVTTNIMNVPVTISWDGYWIDASMPTNQPNLGLKFVTAADHDGATGENPSGGGNQFSFREGSFMVRKGKVLTNNFKPTRVTVAVVPNVHTTFYTQPRLIIEGTASPVVLPGPDR